MRSTRRRTGSTSTAGLALDAIRLQELRDTYDETLYALDVTANVFSAASNAYNTCLETYDATLEAYDVILETYNATLDACGVSVYAYVRTS